MNYNHCRLVEQAERLKAKLRAGTMHEAGRPGEDTSAHGGGRGGSRTLALDPPPWVMPGKAPWGQKPCG